MTATALLAFAAACVGKLQPGEKRKATPRTRSCIFADLKWTPIIKGCELAPVSGDPNADGAPYVLRLRCADGAKIPAHWHPTDENVTVLKGTFLVGMGETFDESKLQPMNVGNFVSMPKEMRHFALMQGRDHRASSRCGTVQGELGESVGSAAAGYSGRSRKTVGCFKLAANAPENFRLAKIPCTHTEKLWRGAALRRVARLKLLCVESSNQQRRDVRGCRSVELRALCNEVPRTPPGPEGSNGIAGLPRVPQITRSSSHIGRKKRIVHSRQFTEKKRTSRDEPMILAGAIAATFLLTCTAPVFFVFCLRNNTGVPSSPDAK